MAGTSVRGYVDQIEVVPEPVGADIALGSTILVRGWAGAADCASMAVMVHVGDVAFRATTGLDRPDVAAAVGPRFRNAGFQAVVPTVSLDVGTYALRATLDGTDLGAPVLLTFAAAGPLFGLSLLPDAPDGSIDTARAGRLDRATAAEPSPTTSDDDIVVTGWAYDRARQQPYRVVLGFINERIVHVAAFGVPRDDVADVYGTPAMNRCGFRLRIPLRGLLAGQHTLQIAAGDSPASPLVRLQGTVRFTIIA